MTELFLDANVILRFLTQDHPRQSARTRTLFEAVDRGETRVTTSEAILVEVVYVLSSKQLYNLPRGQIRDALAAILGLRGVRLPGKRRYLETLNLYAERPSLSFVDALSATQVRRMAEPTVLSFDHDFDRIDGVTRREP